jgi:hypothetical protein
MSGLARALANDVQFGGAGANPEPPRFGQEMYPARQETRERSEREEDARLRGKRVAGGWLSGGEPLEAPYCVCASGWGRRLPGSSFARAGTT